MTDHGSTDLRGAAYYARHAGFDPGPDERPSRQECEELVIESPRPGPRCPVAAELTGWAWHCALPECAAGGCVKAVPGRLINWDGVEHVSTRPFDVRVESVSEVMP